MYARLVREEKRVKLFYWIGDDETTTHIITLRAFAVTGHHVIDFSYIRNLEGRLRRLKEAY